ncbi:polycomb protein suz12-B-like [Lytechinus pictus]|uniref:polycomb protein suz12-B-like n=1 Tax=Lytechinus pictus TaxID=7653 RepID=UPI0030BA16D0
MAPHKHSRASPRKPKLEQLKADHELFLQAFEKPTQIYRFLAARHKISPVFLRRTLTYMLKKKPVKKNFSVDNLLEMKENKIKEGKQIPSHSGKYLKLTFNHLNWNGETSHMENSKATVDLILLKVCHKRRKDICLPVMRVSLGQCEIPINPTAATINSSSHSKEMTIPSGSFTHSNGHTVRSYRLLIQVSCPSVPSLPNGCLCNGDVDSDSDGQQAKRRKLMTRLKDKDMSPSQPSQLYEDEHIASFTSELVVVDKQNRCQLLDGSYELTLQEVQTKSKYQSASWETISDGKPVGPFEVPDLSPRLNFNLSWHTTTTTTTGDSPETPGRSPERSSRSAANLTSSPDHSHSIHTTTNAPDTAKHSALINGQETVLDKKLARRIHPSSSNTGSPSRSASKSSDPDTVEHVFYQFLYNNNTRQQTEARDNLRCPWCSLNCQRLYSLLKHLSTCHSRFNFTYVPHHKNARIDVAINEHYDGSYSGNPHNLITSHMGYAFQRNGPCRRTPVTQILVMKPLRQKETLQEFQEGEKSDYLMQRPYISGHNRTYFHTHSLQPIRPQEMDEDSEDEIDPDWIKERTRMMIDEFSDVNEGEKELMKLWNNHCMKHNFIADSQIPRACSLFIDAHGEDVLRQNLTSNFLLHLINLYDFSLLHPHLVTRFMNQLLRSGQRRDVIRHQVNPEEENSNQGNQMREDADIGPPILYPQEELAVKRDDVAMVMNREGEMSTGGTMEENPLLGRRSLDDKPQLEKATPNISCDESSPKLDKRIEDTV